MQAAACDCQRPVSLHRGDEQPASGADAPQPPAARHEHPEAPPTGADRHRGQHGPAAHQRAGPGAAALRAPDRRRAHHAAPHAEVSGRLVARPGHREGRGGGEYVDRTCFRKRNVVLAYSYSA